MIWFPIHAIIFYMKKSQMCYKMETRSIIINQFSKNNFPLHFFDIKNGAERNSFPKGNTNINNYHTRKYCFYTFYKPISKFI